MWVENKDLFQERWWGHLVDIKTKKIKVNGKYQIKTSKDLTLIYKCEQITWYGKLFIFNT